LCCPGGCPNDIHHNIGDVIGQLEIKFRWKVGVSIWNFRGQLVVSIFKPVLSILLPWRFSLKVCSHSKLDLLMPPGRHVYFWACISTILSGVLMHQATFILALLYLLEEYSIRQTERKDV
jgi:hypothetical protein